MSALSAVTLAVLLLPAAGALLLALGALHLPRWVTWAVGPGVVWGAFICTLVLLADSLAHGKPHDFTYWTWIRSDGFQVPADLLVDRLSIFMCLVVTGVGGLIVTYAVGYMEHETDASYARFFCYMDLFVLSMLLLVLAGNFVFLIVGWAGVGLSSYLLIGFYYWRHSAVVAARKAFVMNVIGDIGMILATFLAFVAYHATTYAGVFRALPRSDNPTLELLAFLLLVGGVAKSAQLPLHTWLPDAMEGPTPVSALIHAATMVTAGVYLVARMHPIYDVAWLAHGAVALIGTATAFFAATVALVQTDIKRVLAYSTMSQIGYMFLAVGVGAYTAGMYHLLSHAFFKALLFMSAGNVIHAMHDEQDMRRYGGLWGQMRWTSLSFLVGGLALAGIFPFVGFWSKELVLGETFSKPGGGGFPQALWAVGLLTAVLTAFYTFRAWWIGFWGDPSPQRPVEHPHEAPPVMLLPVLALALLSTVGGGGGPAQRPGRFASARSGGFPLAGAGDPGLGVEPAGTALGTGHPRAQPGRHRCQPRGLRQPFATGVERAPAPAPALAGTQVVFRRALRRTLRSPHERSCPGWSAPDRSAPHRRCRDGSGHRGRSQCRWPFAHPERLFPQLRPGLRRRCRGGGGAAGGAGLRVSRWC